MIVCDVVADEPSVLDLVAFSGKWKKTYLQVRKDIKPKELKYFHNHFQCATFVGNSYQTFGLATDKTYQTELNLTGPNKNNDFLYNKC